MMNAYFFQMNNLKGLAADESGSSVLVERLARSDRFTVSHSVLCRLDFLSMERKKKIEEVIWTTVYHIGLELVKVALKLKARFLCKNTTSNHPKNGAA